MYFKGVYSGQQPDLSHCIRSAETWMFMWSYSVTHCNETSELQGLEILEWIEAFF